MFLGLPNAVSMRHELFSVSHEDFLRLTLPVSVISPATTLPLAHAPDRLALSPSGLIPFILLGLFTGCSLYLEQLCLPTCM